MNQKNTQKSAIYYGTGRRKSASARVYLLPGQGEVTINGKPMATYIPQTGLQLRLKQPFQRVGAEGRFDCKVTVEGSGISAQTDAIRLGIARALSDYEHQHPEEAKDWRYTLRKAGDLTRDPREKERHKVGFRGRRRKRQYSKR